MKKQYGFTALEGLLILVIAGIVGFAGWYVYSSNNKTQDSYANADQSNSSTVAAKKKKTATAQGQDSKASWKQETNTKFGFSYKYPAENTYSSSVSDFEQIEGPSSQAVSKGSLAAATVGYSCGANCGEIFTVEITKSGSYADPGNNFGEKQAGQIEGVTLVSKKQVNSIDGTKGTRWEYKNNSPPDKSQNNLIYYYFTKGGKSYAINLGTVTYQNINFTDLGEQVYSTFKLF